MTPHLLFLLLPPKAEMKGNGCRAKSSVMRDIPAAEVERICVDAVLGLGSLNLKICRSVSSSDVQASCHLIDGNRTNYYDFTDDVKLKNVM